MEKTRTMVIDFESNPTKLSTKHFNKIVKRLLILTQKNKIHWTEDSRMHCGWKTTLDSPTDDIRIYFGYGDYDCLSHVFLSLEVNKLRADNTTVHARERLPRERDYYDLITAIIRQIKDRCKKDTSVVLASLKGMVAEEEKTDE